MRIQKYFRYFAMPLVGLMLGLVSVVALPDGAWAIDLSGAKASGLVGEKPDGYLGAIGGGGEVAALVADINSKRRAAYQASAANSGTTLQSVEVIAGRMAQDRTPAGQYIMTASGQWVRK